MSDQRVTRKTAELAKEKDFNESTYAHCWVKTLDGEIIHNSERRDIPEHDRSKTHTLQPTQTHLQKWLREKHGIDMTPFPEGTGDNKTYSVEIGGDIISKTVPTNLKSFEEAFEIGLQEALGLIY